MNKICCPYLKNTIKTCDDLKKEKQVITVKILRVKIVLIPHNLLNIKKLLQIIIRWISNENDDTNQKVYHHQI